MFRNTRPSTHSIFGEDKTLLSSLIIQVDCLNELLHFFHTYYPEKINKVGELINNLLSIDDDLDLTKNTPIENFEIYKKKMMEVIDNIINFLN
jgi:hypothetical protein